jgi:dTDP-4-dehydrorhamnose 3,5-epimerase
VRLIETRIPGAWLLAADRKEDDRGFFARIWDERELKIRGLPCHIVQSSVSFNSIRGTLRGLHYQVKPYEETKYVRCTRGSIYDAIIDLRAESPTYLACFTTVLSAENLLTLVVPAGCAHGFLTLKDSCEVTYQIDEPYSSAASRGLRWDDPVLEIRWPVDPLVISERDRNFPDYSA